MTEPPFEVIAAQSEVIGKNQACYEKSRGVQNQRHLKHSFLSIHTMPVAAGSLAYVEHYRSRVYESKSICCLNQSQRPLFLVTNEALIPPLQQQNGQIGKSFLDESRTTH